MVKLQINILLKVRTEYIYTAMCLLYGRILPPWLHTIWREIITLPALISVKCEVQSCMSSILGCL